MTAIEIFGLLGWGVLIALALFGMAFCLLGYFAELYNWIFPPKGKKHRLPPPPYPPP